MPAPTIAAMDLHRAAVRDRCQALSAALARGMSDTTLAAARADAATLAQASNGRPGSEARQLWIKSQEQTWSSYFDANANVRALFSQDRSSFLAYMGGELLGPAGTLG